MAKKPLNKIKTSVLSRGLALTKLTVATGSKALGHSISTLLSDPDLKERKWQEFLIKQAKGISKDLGELKGSLMKGGQMISMYGELFLPPEANEFLKTLQAQSPPLRYEEIEKVLRAQLSPERFSELEIDPLPIGTASLGQVHKARVKKTGEWIALKVQYPGVDKAIDSDLKAIRKFMSALELLPGDFQTNIMFGEVRRMLQQEVDYPLEIKHTKKYRELFGQDPRYVIPRIFDEYCGDKVIATSFEPGLSPDDALIKSLSQERRNRLAENFLDLYFRELFVAGFVQTDPHLGNYKIRLSADGQDQLVLLDFGAVCEYDKNFLQAYRGMIRASLFRDQEAHRETSLGLKFIAADDDPELLRLFEEFCWMTVEPFMTAEDPHVPKGLMDAEGRYDWRASDLPKRLTAKALKIIRGFPLRTPPREVVFLDRKTGGVFIFLSILGAKLSAHGLIQKYLN
jgi:predicted unusual protein kinase regulating ubiquinone biosynthesis (AarF/ABC1/UbiB family)